MKDTTEDFPAPKVTVIATGWGDALVLTWDTWKDVFCDIRLGVEDGNLIVAWPNRSCHNYSGFPPEFKIPDVRILQVRDTHFAVAASDHGWAETSFYDVDNITNTGGCRRLQQPWCEKTTAKEMA
jgi:hypothetical protein